MRPIVLPLSETLTVVPWPDADEDKTGHDPRSRYVERYWLGVLGPSSTWLLRLIADELEASPNGFVMNLEEVARQIGLVYGSKNSPFARALVRLCQFEMAEMQPGGRLAVRRRVPSLSRRHVMRLPASLQQRHDFWQKQQVAGAS